MNILLINHYAGNPKLGMEFRPYYLAKEWIKKGHKVLIVGATYSHLRKEQPKAGFETYEGVDYLWLKTNTYSGNGVRRLCSMFVFVFRLFCHAKQFARFAPDAVVASSTYPLDLYPARYIAKRAKAKLVFEIHDLWPLSPMELGGMSKYHPFIMIMQRAENFAYKHCDYCVSILPCVHKHVSAHGLDLKKLHLVPNGIVTEDWERTFPLSENIAERFSQIKSEFDFIVGYTGGHALSNALDTLLEAAKQLLNSSIAFILVGNGVEKERLQKRVVDEKLMNVFFIDSVPKSQIPSILQLMDLLYVGGNASPLYQFGISPNKIFDYMMASKPIIQSCESGNDLLGTAQCGLTVHSGDGGAVTDAIMKLKAMESYQIQEMGMRGKTYVMQHHSYEILASNFIEIMNAQMTKME